MATKAQLKLPRGIRVFSNPKRKTPHACSWLVRVPGKNKRKPKFRFFSTIAARDTFASSLAGDFRDNGLAAERFSTPELLEYRALRAEIGPNVPLDAVRACWRRHGAERVTLTVRQAITQFLAAKTAEGLAKSTLDHYEPVYDRLSAALGDRDVGAVKREDLAEWVKGLDMADYSKRTHTIRARGLFAWLVHSRAIAEDPCDGLKAVKVIAKPVQILTVEQTAQLFAKNMAEPPELLGRLALEAFAGLRFDSACKITPDDISFARRGIRLPALSIKTQQRFFIDNLPDNLWPWLGRSFFPGEWSMSARQYMEAKTNAFIRANVPHPHNCCRHSAATYRVARDGSVANAATMLCNSEKMIRRHYLGEATQAEGVAYSKILPEG